MVWEYKRIIRVSETMKDNDLEELFNSLGKDGWELITATNLSTGNSQYYKDTSKIEYLFRRGK